MYAGYSQSDTDRLSVFCSSSLTCKPCKLKSRRPQYFNEEMCEIIDWLSQHVTRSTRIRCGGPSEPPRSQSTLCVKAAASRGISPCVGHACRDSHFAVLYVCGYKVNRQPAHVPEIVCTSLPSHRVEVVALVLAIRQNTKELEMPPSIPRKIEDRKELSSVVRHSRFRPSQVVARLSYR